MSSEGARAAARSSRVGCGHEELQAADYHMVIRPLKGLRNSKLAEKIIEEYACWGVERDLLPVHSIIELNPGGTH